jgi:soluble lytic murein transglycosylase-like protein
MSETPELIALTRQVVVSHKLDLALVCAVIDKESEWDTWAVRYEPDFLSRYVWPLYRVGKLPLTEAHLRSMSFGLMQVMGQVAREFGFAGKFLTELCDPRVGVEFGCRVLAKRLAEHGGIRNAALLAYNGGADDAYPGQVLARLPAYSQLLT